MGLRQRVMVSIAAVLLLSLCYLIIFSDNGIMEFKYLKQQQDELIEENEAIIQQNLSLYRKVERLETDFVYIERVARKELGVIGTDEVILKLAD